MVPLIKTQYSHPFAQLLPAPESEVRYVSGRKRCPRTPLRSFDKHSISLKKYTRIKISTHLVADTRLQIYLNTSWYISCGTNSNVSCYFIKVYPGLIKKQVKVSNHTWISRRSFAFLPFEVVMDPFHSRPNCKESMVVSMHSNSIRKRRVKKRWWICAYPRRV